ncbi:hypothetical protein ES708_35104 [subsurface metagenome]
MGPPTDKLPVIGLTPALTVYLFILPCLAVISRKEDNRPPRFAGRLLLYRVKSLTISELNEVKKPKRCELLYTGTLFT